VRYARYTGSGTATPVDVLISSGPSYNAHHLLTRWNAASNAVGATIQPALKYAADGTIALFCNDHASRYIVLTVQEGDPLWALGFEPGEYVQTTGNELSIEAQGAPRLWVVDLSGRTTCLPRIYVDDASGFEEDHWCVPPGAPYSLIDNYDTTADYVELATNIADPVRPYRYFASIEADDNEDLLLRQAFVFSSHWDTDLDNVTDAIKRSMGHLGGATEPVEWTLPLITSADVDYDELDTALGGVPTELSLFTAVVTEPVEWQELFGPHLGLLGIAPRITTDGKVGWARISTPTDLDAVSVEVDDEVWELVESASIAARIGGALLTGIELQYGYDYRGDEWPDASHIRWWDWAAETGQQRDQSYQLRGVATSTRMTAFASDRGELDGIIATVVRGTHFGLFGRDAVDVDIPCTFLGWQIRCGDVVKITHPMIPDIGKGVLGVASRLGVVVGRRLPIAGDEGVGTLTVRIPPDTNASNISPCARGDNWDVGSLTLTCSGAKDPLYAATGGNDLDELATIVAAEGDTAVLLWEYDVASPTGAYPLAGTVTSVDTDAETVTFTADPFSGGGIPAGDVEMTWPVWDSQSALQQAWLSISDTSYGLGATPDAGWKWGV